MSKSLSMNVETECVNIFCHRSTKSNDKILQKLDHRLIGNNQMVLVCMFPLKEENNSIQIITDFFLAAFFENLV